MSNLLVAVNHRENARLLREYLDQHHSTTVLSSKQQFDKPFDLGIFDGHTLNQFWTQIQTRKHSEAPLFLPVLLITPRQDVTLITRQLWQVIDEVIFTPIDKLELGVRVEILLRTRRLSLIVQSQNTELKNEIAAHQITEKSLRESEERFRMGLQNSPIVVARMDTALRYIWISNTHSLQTEDMIGKRDDEILGVDAARTLMALKQNVLDTGHSHREEILLDMGELHKVYDMTFEPIFEDNTVIGLRTAAYDITDRKQTEDSILKLHQLVIELSKLLTFDDVAEHIIRYAITTLGATAGAIVLLNADRKTFSIIHAIGYPDAFIDAWQDFSMDLSEAPLVVAVRSKTPLFSISIEEMRAAHSADGSRPRDETNQGWAALPFEIDAKMVGGLALSFSSTKTFDETERGFMLTLAHQCAQAFQRVHLVNQLQSIAVSAERQRLARDLHDAVSQALFASSTMADSIPTMWDKRPERARELLNHVATLNRGALAEMRTLLFELRPEALIRTDIKVLLRQLLDAVKARRIMETTLDVTGDPIVLPHDVHVAFYRIAQESLNNITKHSQATHIHVTLNYAVSQATLEIRDNGQGFDRDQTAGGLGLGGMQERAHMSRLKLQVNSTLGQGAQVLVMWQPEDDV